MALWSRQLACRGITSGSYTTVYTVPSGKLGVIRSLIVNNDSGSARSVIMRAGPAGADFPFVTGLSLASHARLEWDHYLCLVAGDNVRFYADGSDVFVWLSGYELTV